MQTLKDWGLAIDPFLGMGLAYGNVYGHYRLEDGHRITTSVINDLWKIKEKGTYVIRTYSGSVYQLLPEEMNEEHRKETKNAIAYMGIDIVNESYLDSIVADDIKEINALVERNKGIIEGADAWAKENLNTNELYLIVDNLKTKKAVFMDESHELHEIEPQVHLGMVQDSVIVADSTYNLVDFRYFPRGCMEPYRWSDTVERLRIYNYGKEEFVIRIGGQDVICEAGVVTTVDRPDI